MSSFSVVLPALFWLCLATVAFAYAGYPVVIFGLARLFGRRRQRPELDPCDLPCVSLLIAAYNEEAVIEARLRNALELDYPREKLEIVVASDGSADATAAIVRRYADRGVRLLQSAERRGKAGALNASFPQLRGDIVLLSDANTHMERHVLRKILPWFRDSGVGIVCGRLILTDPETGRNADSLYWRYETFLKRCESSLGALLGSNGAIYAIRRALFMPIPNQTILDDFVIPLAAKLRTGCAILYDCEAVALEETAPDVRAEFRRRSRIGAGGFQCIGLLWKLLDPRRGWIAFTFFAHKILRWCCPFLLLGMLATNLLLCDQPLYRPMLLGQVGFYLLSLAAALLPAQFRSLKPLRLTTLFTSMNLALLLGFCRWLRGGQTGTWQRTARLVEATASAVGARP
jgi:cellulose synthase/poly-beta-1,6-N-acetylglucosamine synthase-like glycosyltransferase